MRRLLFLVLLALPLSLSAQRPDFNSESFWKRLALEDKPSVSHVYPDTAIIVISNRVTGNDSLHFLGEMPGGKLSYFFVYTYEGRWHVLRVKNLSEALQYIPDKDRDWVVYTEGMGRIFTSALDRGLRLSGTYKVNVIMLDYPSINSTYGGIRNYYFAMNNARNAYIDFVPALDTMKQLRLQQKMGTGRISLFFHSMGNNVMKEMMSTGKHYAFNDTVWVDNIILNAPCVPQRKHELWLQKISFAKNIYVHYNPDDYVLKAAHIISLKKQLGEKVRTPVCTNKNISYINFHSLTGKNHSNFLSLPGRAPAQAKAVKHYQQLFHGTAPDLKNDSLYRVSGYRGIGFDLLP